MRVKIDDYFMMIAFSASVRSTCPRRAVGAILVKDKKIVSTGYNGAPSGMRDCDVDGCLMYQDAADRPRCINTVHAELNAILQANDTGDVLYCTDKPCINCLKAALAHNPNIKIIWARDYTDEARDIFVKHHGIECLHKYEGEKP